MMLLNISKRAFATSAPALKHAASPASTSIRSLGDLTIPEKMISIEIDEAGVVHHNYLFDEAGLKR